MNRQSQWLFEAPMSLVGNYYTNPYVNQECYVPEWKAERALQAIPAVHLPVDGQSTTRNQSGSHYPLAQPNSGGSFSKYEVSSP